MSRQNEIEELVTEGLVQSCHRLFSADFGLDGGRRVWVSRRFRTRLRRNERAPACDNSQLVHKQITHTLPREEGTKNWEELV